MEYFGRAIREWCFQNLRRPATVYFYKRYGDFSHKAQLYRRPSKVLGNHASWSYVTEDRRMRCFYEIEFEDSVDEEMFLIRWLSFITIVGYDFVADTEFKGKGRY